MCCIFATAPLLNKKIIMAAYKKLLNGKYDFVFGAIKAKSSLIRAFYVKNKKLKMINSNFYSTNSQDLPDIFIDSGKIY